VWPHRAGGWQGARPVGYCYTDLQSHPSWIDIVRGRNTEEPRISVLAVAVEAGERLRRCLEPVRQQAEALHAEVVLVINAAEGALAPAAVEALRKLCDVLAFEPSVGKSHALNTGVSLCRGEVIAFTDDDAVPEPGWLEALTGPLLDADRPASRVGTGGRVVPVYPNEDPPAWYRRLVEDKDRHFLGPAHDLGESTREYRRPGEASMGAPVGANCAYRREVFQRYRYDPQLGPNRETGGRGGEDVELGFRLLLDGHSLLYVPSARVEHPVIPERVTWQSIRQHYYVNGAEWIRVLRKLDLPVPRPEHLKRRLARRRRRLPFRWLFDPRGHRRRQAKILAARGMLDELEHHVPPPSSTIGD
jgi:GT2 family glycosyltransferase